MNNRTNMKGILENPFQALFDMMVELKAEVAELKQMRSKGADTILSREEAAKYLKVHVDTITRLVNSGQLKKSSVGRNLKFKQSDLDQYLDDNA
ncbi:helix-turn-helix domain-containing protein [Sphingobacterium sp. UBA2074]|uniref:helix-turn-helix domain-containing protein n=1 Tax=Sphingobacterium sp. UBA2074 TaxID=1947487 RepID=UPI00257C7BB4|nr:helix-turn-helix domain-containing protein [Sphingobacterium sp. UBA2074]